VSCLFHRRSVTTNKRLVPANSEILLQVMQVLLVVGLCFVFVDSSDVGWQFGERAWKQCKAAGRKVPKGACGVLQDLVEETFDGWARQIGDAFNVSSRDCDERMQKPAFLFAGNMMIDQLVDFVVTTQASTQEAMHKTWQDLFFKWYMRVVENEEPDLSPPGMPSQEELLKMMEKHKKNDL